MPYKNLSNPKEGPNKVGIKMVLGSHTLCESIVNAEEKAFHSAKTIFCLTGFTLQCLFERSKPLNLISTPSNMFNELKIQK